MQVNAAGDGGKGKNGKGKDKNKSKNGKGKDRDNNSNSGLQAAQFQGWCSHCAKWGHQRAECRTRLAQHSWGSCWSSRTGGRR